MYQIYCDGYLLHSDIPEYQLIDVKLQMEVNKPGNLSFTILPEHPNLSTLLKRKSEIKVYKNNIVYWKGRIVEDNINLDLSHEIYCEGKLKALNDTLIRPDIFDDTADNVLTSYLNLHNAQVLEFQQIKPGTLQITDDIYRDLKNYESTLSRVDDLVNSVGGYLFLRYESDGDYLDWLTDFSTTSTQEINLGENILNLSQEITAQETYSACIPLGAKQVDENGTETETRLTVSSIQGVDYVFDQAKVNLYGWVFAPISETTWDDVTLAANLLSRANDFLAASGTQLTLTITALDLAYTDADIDSFNFCEYVTVNSSYHNISDDYLLSRLDLDITNPANTRITLGQVVTGITEKQKQDRDNVTLTVNDLQDEITGVNVNLGEEVAQREAYIRYSGGVIEMGETNSDLKMRLSNTELAFVESISGVETEVAYIENPTGNPGDSKLYIENGEIVQTLKIGDFEFSPRDNGNMSLLYKG